MLTFQDLYTRFTKITSDSSTSNIAFGKQLINETHKLICGNRDWHFCRETNPQTSTASQQIIKLPVNHRKLVTLNITSGGVKYTPQTEIADTATFDKINSQGTSVTSDFPQFYHIRNGNVLLYPAISSAGLTITTESLITPKDMSADNYTTGTISALANGGTEVTGSGTTFTSAMTGRYLKITSEGNWYKISSVTDADTLVLDKPYEGTSIVAGSEAYIIAELPLIPEQYQDLLWYRPVGIYFMMKGDEAKSRYYFSGNKRFPGMYESQYQEMVREEGSQTTDNVMGTPGEYYVRNINFYPKDLT